MKSFSGVAHLQRLPKRRFSLTMQTLKEMERLFRFPVGQPSSGR
jgi:hypothetical protein